jgi:adenine phosphoribosyltransferase
MFRDITTLLKDKDALREAIKKMAEYYKNKKIEMIVGSEARGFIFGSVLAYELDTGFIPVRKKGKLPAKVVKTTYYKEYGPDTLCIHQDSIKPGQKILIVDDLLATGGTTKATIDLVEKLGGDIVGLGFLIELCYLNAREKFEKKYEIFSLIKYFSEEEGVDPSKLE